MKTHVCFCPTCGKLTEIPVEQFPSAVPRLFTKYCGYHTDAPSLRRLWQRLTKLWRVWCEAWREVPGACEYINPDRQTAVQFLESLLEVIPEEVALLLIDDVDAEAWRPASLYTPRPLLYHLEPVAEWVPINKPQIDWRLGDEGRSSVLPTAGSPFGISSLLGYPPELLMMAAGMMGKTRSPWMSKF